MQKKGEGRNNSHMLCVDFMNLLMTLFWNTMNCRTLNIISIFAGQGRIRYRSKYIKNNKNKYSGKSVKII